MLGIDPVVATTLLVLASGGGGKALVCPDHEPTQILMRPKTEDVDYDSSQSLAKIQNYNMDTVDPYAFHGETITQGFMDGRIQVKQQIKFGQAVMQKYDAACLWYDTIVVEIKIDPKIIIASEMYKDSCMRKAIIGHELKHVRVDREIVNKYAKSMGKKLYSALKSRGFEAGPFEAARLDEVGEKMQTVVKQILDLESQKMSIERQERQREVDNRNEYNRVDDLCPAFKKKKAKLYAEILDKN